jgi:hypothetical protein
VLEGAAIEALVDAIAHSVKDAGDTRTLSQIRADVLCERLLARAAAADGGSGVDGEVRVVVNIHTPADSLLHQHPQAAPAIPEPEADAEPELESGADGATAWHDADAEPHADTEPQPGPEARPEPEAAPAEPESAEPATTPDGGCCDGEVGRAVFLDGYGQVPARIADWLLSQPGALARRVLCDPATGQPLALGRTRRHASKAQRDLIPVRDRTCRFPGCSRQAARCQVDHSTPWKHGGSTDIQHLHALCQRHNLIADSPGWKIHLDPDTRELTVTDPGGQAHTSRPEWILRFLHEAHPEPPKPPPPPPKTVFPDKPPF